MENSNYKYDARIKFFDNNSRKKIDKKYTVLNVFVDKIFVLDNSNRKIINSIDITEIELFKSKNKINSRKLSGGDLEDLLEIEPGSFISGKIYVYGFVPNIKNSDYVRLIKSIDNTSITLNYAEPQELNSIVHINQAKENKIKDLRLKLSSHQIDQLKVEEEIILNNIKLLKSRGFYANYSRIIKLNGELKKLQSRIDTLNMKIATGSDEPILREIKMIEDGYRINYDLWVYRF